MMAHVMKYCLYVIQSGEAQYAGITKDFKNRLKRHNAGDNRSTKHHKDWKLIYIERFKTLSEARRKELYIKKGKKGVGKVANLVV